MQLRMIFALSIAFFTFFPISASSHDLREAAQTLKKSVVGIGVYTPIGTVRNKLVGTGFVIGDGTLIATNHHVIEKALEPDANQRRVIYVGEGERPTTIEATVLKTDPARDLAILKINSKLTPLPLAPAQRHPDGAQIVFSGFPIGIVLGLYPATHSGYIAAYTPVAIPSVNSSELSIEMLKRLRDPFYVYQLDATAYPGNSGSPVLDPDSGQVIGIINKVFVKKTKEAVLSDPSGISYAIPVRYLHDLLSTLD